jgi:hypothetical protein
VEITDICAWMVTLKPFNVHLSSSKTVEKINLCYHVFIILFSYYTRTLQKVSHFIFFSLFAVQTLEHQFSMYWPFFSIHLAHQSLGILVPLEERGVWLRSHSRTVCFTSSSSAIGQPNGNRKGSSLGCGQGAEELPISVFDRCWWWSVTEQHPVTNTPLVCTNSRPEFIS